MPRALLLVTASLLAAGCAARGEPPRAITLATTTSTRDSGLLDVLLPRFQQQTGIEVRVVAVGSGQALELGRRGDADVLLTHSPAAEAEFLADGSGIERRPVMHNDFVLVGPPADPAGVRGLTSISTAFARLAETGATFVSRGDESGTHAKEREIWQQPGAPPRGAWYLSAGGGMAQTLRLASERQAYTLSDRGTFLAHRERLELALLAEGDPLLRNEYAVILLDPKQHPQLQHAAARRFADFLVAPQTQRVIARFGLAKFGQPLFFPREPGR